jgi:signal transduction histidine kinase
MESEFINNNKLIIKNNVDILYNTLQELQKNTENELRKSIKDRVYEAHTIATKIYNENKNKDKKTITKLIKDALVDIRFNDGRGYFYIYSFDYECILFPLNRDIEGSDFYNFQDSHGKYLTRDIISQLKKENEGFMSWYFYKPLDKNNHYRKVGFNKYFEPMGWFIGTGEYLDEYEESIKKDALKYIKSLKYFNNNYIFVLDYDGRYLSHIKKEIIGKDAIKAEDVKNSQWVIKKAIDIAKNEGSGFLSYVQSQNPNSMRPSYKISYVRGVDNWNWLIGQGFYEDDYKAKLKEKKEELSQKFNLYIKNIITLSLVLMIVLLIISIYISKILQKKFDKYKNEIKEYLNERTQQQELLAHQSKMAAMGEMIGNIAHQWRQPLSVITTAASGVKLNKEMDTLNDKNLIESMDIINIQANYLSKTIEDFRNFLKENHEKEYFSLTQVIEDSTNLTYAQFKNKRIEIIKEINEISLYGLKNQLIQVFINLLNNSKDEFEKSEDKRRLIFIKSYIQKDDVYIVFQDSAGGISTKIIDRIFEPYFSTKHQYQGTGIGLYMSQEIITKIFNGEISVSNSSFEYEGEKYEGAIFSIKLPIE